MDEYFSVLDRVAQLKAVPARTKALIAEVRSVRAGRSVLDDEGTHVIDAVASSCRRCERAGG
jgi:hypothetical protein